jgi:hypothetical protein
LSGTLCVVLEPLVEVEEIGAMPDVPDLPGDAGERRLCLDWHAGIHLGHAFAVWPRDHARRVVLFAVKTPSNHPSARDARC